MFDKRSYRPFPQRNELMYLSTISKSDMTPRRKTWERSHSNSLRTDDISGARPRLGGYQFLNKPSPPEHKKSFSTTLKKPFFSLMTSDIDQAQPNAMGFRTSRFGHNPLNPNYNLPSFTRPPATPPKFLRDTLDLSDLNQKFPRLNRHEHDPLLISDIPGTKTKERGILTKPNFHCPRDINLGEEEVKGRNSGTNPLMPVYQVRDEDGNLINIGEIDGNKPQVYSPYRVNEYPRSLATEDIEGAGPFRPPVPNKFPMPDVEGSKPGTLKKGITTSRMTHPLDPKYNWKTDETPVKEPEEKTEQEPLQLDKKSLKASSVPSIKSEETGDNFGVNCRHFFGQSPKGTPNTEKRAFRMSAEKYFESGHKMSNAFHNIHKGSIHRVKERRPVQSDGFAQDCDRFFNSSRSSSHKSEYKFGLTRQKIQKPYEKASS